MTHIYRNQKPSVYCQQGKHARCDGKYHAVDATTLEPLHGLCGCLDDECECGRFLIEGCCELHIPELLKA